VVEAGTSRRDVEPGVREQQGPGRDRGQGGARIAAAQQDGGQSRGGGDGEIEADPGELPVRGLVRRGQGDGENRYPRQQQHRHSACDERPETATFHNNYQRGQGSENSFLWPTAQSAR
jgi:hypothetical protein